MQFLTASNKPRPIRLSKKTRIYADLSIRGKYGEQIKKTPSIEIDKDGFEQMPLFDQYDYAIKEIAKKAPVRIADDELVSGSATLYKAIKHKIPVTFKGEDIWWSVSHLTIDFKTTVDNGIEYYEQKINQRLKDQTLTDHQKRFLQSLLGVIESLRVYHKRYLKATKEIKPQIYQNLCQVPFKKATNFYQAVQSIWFIFSFVRLTGNWPGIGRIDQILGDYLKKDLADGTLTLKQAREILASFFIKGTEWIEKDTKRCSGDAQHYQNIVLSGIDENGKDVTNEVTYLVLDIIEELGISDFPITVRINKKTKTRLLNKVAKVIRHGGGVVAVYNEDLILKSLTDYGYPLKEARGFANDGCWEVQIPGKTNFMYYSFDALMLLQNKTLNGYEKEFDNYESLYSAFVQDLFEQVKSICDERKKGILEEKACEFKYNTPASVVSLFEQGCIENARGYNEGGAVYNVRSPHMGGVADAVNALYAIKKVVFDQKLMSFSEFMSVLKNDWQGNEQLRALVKSFNYYGTDNDEVDQIYARLIDDFHLACKEQDNFEFARFPAGLSTFGRELSWAQWRQATPAGQQKNAILASNSSPTPGTDTEGATAVIKSYCKADLSKMVTGTALDIKLMPKSLSGESGITALKSLIKGFVNLGGYFMQLDTVDVETLKKAQENPKDFKTLSVRVSGWNARFITLTKEWQDMIINRTTHNG